MRVTRRVRHILSIPFLTKRLSLSDTKYKDTTTTTAKVTTNPTATTTATTTTTTTLNNDTDDAVHLDARDLTDAKSSSTFDDDVISDDSELEAESGSGFEHEHEHASGKSRVRIITWHLDDSPGGCRWTLEQERELHIALQHLDRCQKAWSSEQEVWLAYVCLSFSFSFSSSLPPSE